MVDIDWEKVKEEHPAAECINLNTIASIQDNDNITIIQHPSGGELSFSSSTCTIYSKQSIIL